MTDTTQEVFEEIKIDDLVTEVPGRAPSPVADRNMAIGLINEAIDLSKPWKVEEMADGKELDVFPEWKGEFIDKIVWEYRYAGWNVLHFMHGTREYLAFYHPNRKKTYEQAP